MFPLGGGGPPNPTNEKVASNSKIPHFPQRTQENNV